MNPNWTDVKDLWDIIDHIWIGLVVIAAAAIPSVLAARNHKSLGEIKGQVVNGHKDSPPLRADIDRVIQAVDDLTEDVRTLRQEIMAVDERRRVQVAGIYDELDHRKRHNL